MTDGQDVQEEEVAVKGFNLSEFDVNPEKEEKGVWVDWEGGRFRIAGTGNKKYKSEMRKKGIPFQNKIKHGGNLDRL